MIDCRFVFSVALLFASAESHAIDYAKYERGHFWCNEQKWNGTHLDQTHKDVAKRGYLYVLAAALALQKDSPESQAHFFGTPERMKLVDKPGKTDSGFEVSTFAIYSSRDPTMLQEVVIAFAGSNDAADWFLTNTGLDKRQFDEAVAYVVKIAKRPEYQDTRIVLSGYSLGGGLAVHATKNPASSVYVKEAWALNPSPRTRVDKKPDERIWLAAVRKEILSNFRRNLGAYPEHVATDYYFVKAHSSYSHFRYVLTRNILFSADIAMTEDPENPSKAEPLQVLGLSRFDSCKHGKSN